MTAVWAEESKYRHWLTVELLAVEARVGLGDVPSEEFDELKAKASFDVGRIHDLEKKTRHDVAAFVDNVAEVAGPSARHLHYGMTSSDVLDTALALQMREASQLLLSGLSRLISTVIDLARRHRTTLMVARTHGIHAEPFTFGIKAAGWAFELDRAKKRLALATESVSVGKLSGAVGTYTQLPPSVEEFVCGRLGLIPEQVATQVVARDRHAEYAAALGLAAAAIERMATELRHLGRTEVGEAEEPFAEGEQKGSSAMPHKRNPWRSERLSGLARIVRAGVVPAIENIALWHERDISHSSVERVMLPDACLALDFMIAEANDIFGNLVVNEERMRQNLDRSFGLVFSQSVLLQLIDSGMTRDEAYRIVQEAAMAAYATGTHLKELIGQSPEVNSRLSKQQIESCFDESRYLEHAAVIIERLDLLEGS